MQQNVGLCLFFSVLAGITTTLVAILSEDDSAKAGYMASRCCKILATVVNLMFGALGALWFGPISLFGPTVMSSKMISMKFSLAVL